MPPKQQTPYQISKGLSYSQDIPPFLRAMKGLVPAEPGLDAKRPRLPSQFQDEDDDEEEDEVPDDEKPTVVQLSKKHLSAADVERIANGEDVRPGNAGSEEKDDEETGRPQFRRPTTKDKKRKGGESEGKGDTNINKDASNDKKKRKKEKKLPVIQLNHLEENDGEEEYEKSEAKTKRSTKASPRIRLPQYDGAIDDVEHDARIIPKKSSAASNTGKSESKAGPVWSGLVSYYDDDEGDNEEDDVESSPRQAGTTALPGLLHYSVEDDSEEEVESEKQRQTAILRVPPVGPAKAVSKPASPSPNTPQTSTTKAPGVVSSRPTAIPSSFSAPQSENPSGNSSLSSSPRNNSGANLSPHPQTLMLPPKKVPIILSEMRALLKPQASESWVIPPEPQGNPDPDVQARIEKYHALRLQGLHYNENLQKNKKYRNPHIYSKLVEFVELDETGTNFSSDQYNPKGFDKDAYYDAIAISQRKRAEELAALQQSGNRSSVSFVTQQQPNRPGGGVTMEPTPSIAASIAAAKAKAAEIAAASRAKRTSKWDQPAGDAKRVRGV